MTKWVVSALSASLIVSAQVGADDRAECYKQANAVLKLQYEQHYELGDYKFDYLFRDSLEHSETELDRWGSRLLEGKDIGVRGSDQQISRTRKVAGWWNENKEKEDFRDKWRSLKHKREREITLSSRDFSQIMISTMPPGLLDAWREAFKSCGDGEPRLVTSVQENSKYVVLTLELADLRPDSVKEAVITGVQVAGCRRVSPYAFVEGETKIAEGTPVTQTFEFLDDEAFITITTSDGYGFAKFNKKQSAAGPGNVPLGTVIASVLPFDAFSRANKNYIDGQFNVRQSPWAPADGRSVNGSQLQELTSRSSVPDLRGQFLRGSREMWSGDNPAGYVNGTYQPNDFVTYNEGFYQYQSPGTGVPRAGFDAYVMDRSITQYDAQMDQSGDRRNVGHVAAAPGRWGTFESTGTDGGERGFYLRLLRAEERRPLKIDGDWDGETRPMAAIVYYYVRIN